MRLVHRETKRRSWRHNRDQLKSSELLPVGKWLGVPVYQLMGGLARARVACYPHNVGHSMEIDSLVESCLQTQEEGWKFVRWGLPAADPLFDP